MRKNSAKMAGAADAGSEEVNIKRERAPEAPEASAPVQETPEQVPDQMGIMDLMARLEDVAERM
jgi:hypothetical protein